jgi:hypothetical protein
LAGLHAEYAEPCAFIYAKGDPQNFIVALKSKKCGMAGNLFNDGANIAVETCGINFGSCRSEFVAHMNGSLGARGRRHCFGAGNLNIDRRFDFIATLFEFIIQTIGQGAACYLKPWWLVARGVKILDGGNAIGKYHGAGAGVRKYRIDAARRRRASA